MNVALNILRHRHFRGYNVHLSSLRRISRDEKEKEILEDAKSD